MKNLKKQIEKDIIENIKQVEDIRVLKAVLTLTSVVKNKSKAI